VSFHPATQSRNGNTQAYWFQQSACLLLIGLVQVTWPPLTQSPWTQDVPFCLTSFGHCRAYFGMLGWGQEGTVTSQCLQCSTVRHHHDRLCDTRKVSCPLWVCFSILIVGVGGAVIGWDPGLQPVWGAHPPPSLPCPPSPVPQTTGSDYTLGLSQ
jgi:hypothetical protein